jgi:hypothetical protein
METSFKISVACLLVLAVVPLAVHGQVALNSPPDGADISTPPPTFSWSGPYDAWLFISVFYYDIAGTYTGYYPVHFWLLANGFPMPGDWWDKIGAGELNYWFVLGVEQATGANDRSLVQTFTKNETTECVGETCGGYTFDCTPGASCICFLTTEGTGACINDFGCGSAPTCGTTDDCPSGMVCITQNCCTDGLNRCGLNVCTTGAVPTWLQGLEEGEPTAAGR